MRIVCSALSLFILILISPSLSAAPCVTTSTAAPTSVCAGTGTTTLTNSQASGFGVTHQWQVSINGGGYNNIAGATTNPYVTAPGLITAGNTYTFRCVVAHLFGFGACTSNPSSATANVTTIALTTAAAGIDQSICSGTTATMAGNAVGGGETGTWTWVSGTGSGTITTPNSETTTITGLVAGSNTYRWTITSGSCSSTDDVVIAQGPLTADAGSDQSVCTTTGTMNGTAASGGATGAWSLISGTGTITTPASEITGLTALGLGANVFRWTVSKAGCTTVTDDVTITRFASCLQLNLAAPSFDTTSNGEFIVSPWTSCGICCSGGICTVAPTPDTQIGMSPGPSNGTSFVGFQAGETLGGTAEAISQELITPMVAGMPYQLTIDVAYSSFGFFTNDSPEFVIMGAFSCCEYSEELYSTAVTTTTWTTKNIIFTPTYNNTHIILLPRDAGSDGSFVYVLIDNMTNINTSGTPNPPCTPTSINQCAPVVVLPIELLSFDALAIKNEVLVTWVTASEINNDYYTIERSRDGENFEAIGHINGMGNSSQAKTYQFIDKQPLKGISYYRLRQTDFDGQSETFDMKAVNFMDERAISDIYPNPSNNNLFFNVGETTSSTYTVIYYDVLGGMIEKELIPLTEGTNTYSTKRFTNLNSGIYFLEILNENGKILKHDRVVKK